MTEPTPPSVPKSWIVDFWAAVFAGLARVSVFQVLRQIFPPLRSNYAVVDAYVTVHTFGALIILAVVTWRRDEPVTGLYVAVLVYALLRIFEIAVYQVNVLLFDEYRAQKRGIPYVLRGYRRIVILLLHNYLELVGWFGVIYVYLYRSGDIMLTDGMAEPTFALVFRESLLMMVSFSAEKSDAGSSLGIVLLSVHSIVGLLMTLLVLARAVSLLPAPASLDPTERRADRGGASDV